MEPQGDTLFHGRLMTEEAHAQALEELRSARARLRPAQDIRAYVELSFGMAFHLLCVGAQRQVGVHREQHEGMARWLRERGHAPIAEVLAELESVRTGRWYGRQGNGHTAERIDELLAAIEAWALA